MARRRQHEPDTALPVMPARLLDCVVEDWLTPGELYDPEFGKTGSTLDRDPNMHRDALMLAARRRCQEARKEWAVENDLELRDYPAISRPRFRADAP